MSSWLDKPKTSAEFLYHLYHEQGKTLDDIADMIGVAPGTIWYRMQKYGIPRRARGNVDLREANRDRNSEMRRLRHEEKWTLQEIADRFCISRERVRQKVGNTGYIRQCKQGVKN